MKWIDYDKQSMSLHIKFGKHYKVLQCPFATWWKARKYFRRPKFRFYFGPTVVNHGLKQSKWGEYMDYTQKGFWPMASTEYLKWSTPKWFPIHIMSWDICWKDKYNTPRFERCGYFIIFFGRDFHKCWQLGFEVNIPEIFIYDCTQVDHEDNYWESILWYLYYNKEYHSKEPDLLKARDTLQGHWSRDKRIKVKKYKIVSSRVEKILNSEYLVLSLKSKYLTNLLLWDFGLTQKMKLSISIKNENETRIVYSKFINNVDNKVIDVFIPKNDINSKFEEMFKSGFTDSELEIIKEVDLGPTFKDQFLTKRGIKLIRNGNNSSV